jgi:hypothetical protein
LGLPLLGIELGNPLHPTGLNLLQALDGLAGGKDKALLSARAGRSFSSSGSWKSSRNSRSAVALGGV